jgi:2-octaprenyl-6-methoxyphenol hydroxylase
VNQIVVIGAGPVGATFALLAHARGLKVKLLDARAGASRETRSLALSHGSREILMRAGAWSAQMQPSEIHTVHTSQRGGFGRVVLSREDAGVPALGYVVGYAALQDELDAALAASNIEVIWEARVSALSQHDANVEITYTQGGIEKSLDAPLLVMADGGANLDKLPEITVAEKDYGQSALLATISADRAHRNIAYERFTAEGPLALLPYAGERQYAMVWVAAHEKIDTLMAETDQAVCSQFQTAFGTRAGKFSTLTGRRRYPLKLRQASERVTGRVAIIGNAAQAMHPVAGQGFNLGLRDAQVLAEVLADAAAKGTLSSTTSQALAAYAMARDNDVSRGIGFTDLLADTFLSDAATLRVPRGLALAATDMLPVLRRHLAQRMMFGAQG